MERKFTPGPWVPCFFNGARAGIDATPSELSVIRMGEGDDNSGVYGNTDEEAIFNTYLIAAAPDMFDALVAIQTTLYDQNSSYGKQIAAALSKATGTQPKREGE